MRHACAWLLLSAVLLVPLHPARACLWDSDALEEEALLAKGKLKQVFGY